MRSPSDVSKSRSRLIVPNLHKQALANASILREDLLQLLKCTIPRRLQSKPGIACRTSSALLPNYPGRLRFETLIFITCNFADINVCAAGISRLERWQRAHKLGLDPPQAVKDILDTASDVERERLNQATWENKGI